MPVELLSRLLGHRRTKLCRDATGFWPDSAQGIANGVYSADPCGRFQSRHRSYDTQLLSADSVIANHERRQAVLWDVAN